MSSRLRRARSKPGSSAKALRKSALASAARPKACSTSPRLLSAAQIDRIEIDGRAEVGERTRDLAFAPERNTAVVVGCRRVGIERDCHREILDGLIEPAALQSSQPPVDVGLRQTGVQPESLVHVGDGEVVTALLQIRGAAVVVGPRISRLERQGHAVVRDRLLELLGGRIGIAAIVEHRGELAIRDPVAAHELRAGFDGSVRCGKLGAVAEIVGLRNRRQRQHCQCRKQGSVHVRLQGGWNDFGHEGAVRRPTGAPSASGVKQP